MAARPDTADEPALEILLRRITRRGDDALPLEDRVRLAERIRAHSPHWSAELDQHLIAETDRLCATVREVQQRQRVLEEVHQKLTAPPWHPAVMLGITETSRGTEAVVSHAGSVRVVGILGLDPGSLRPGDDVLLGTERNVVLGRLEARFQAVGDTAEFRRVLPDGRIVVRSRDEEYVVRATGLLEDDPPRHGDLVRWSRTLGLAFERLGRSSGEGLFLEDTPADRFAALGGLDHQIERLQRSIRLHLERPDMVRRYGLRRKSSVLLAGPPGTGKTLMARALANWLAELSPSGRSRFMNVKPAGLHSMWYAQSEANYREAFRVAREAGAREPAVPVVMFFDEVDAIGGVRGQALRGVDDRVLTAFMAELDGLESRGNILVVAATNRRDALDPALLRPGRLGDLVLEIPRPGAEAAAQIFARHLPADLPWAPGEGSEAVIAAAVSRLYAPNGMGDLATLTFRDGRRRPVRAADLVSGALIAAICQAALERACQREHQAGEAGLGAADLLSELDAALATAAAALTPRNCHQHLDDLPQDLDVVKVEPVVRRARAEYRVLRAR